MRTSNKQGQNKSLSAHSKAGEQRGTIIPTPLPEQVSHNIETIIDLHARHEKQVSRNQRFVEDMTLFFGRPRFLYSILFVIVFWITCNSLPRRFRLPRFDPPPFAWLQGSVTVSSLLMTTGVLITQNRQAKLANQRAQLNLQINLLSEQKMAKLIALIEELRQDSPDVIDRQDDEAEKMKETVDPHMVVDVLEETLAEELEDLEE
ncbi:MAG: DUF1003 domain-containing protein [Rhizonema sp. NSF051]|nr:DUF1003 domain-containing protein [Rhizonema sp. NSF051]